MIKHTKVSPSGTGLQISVPLFEPNGDQILVYVEERGDKIDGGRINGILFGAGPKGASKNDYKLASLIVHNAELEMDSERGIAFGEADERTMNYWIMEVGRTIAVVASVIPTNIESVKRSVRS